MGENTADCEVAYETALYMLYAIIDSSRTQNNAKDEDQVTVDKCESFLISFRGEGLNMSLTVVTSIQGRLTSLRKKMIQ